MRRTFQLIQSRLVEAPFHVTAVFKGLALYDRMNWNKMSDAKEKILHTDV